jgi:hypothetical protein
VSAARAAHRSTLLRRLATSAAARALHVDNVEAPFGALTLRPIVRSRDP